MSSRRRALWITGVASLIALVVLGALDREMTDAGGPGIIGFELAASEDRAEEIKADWGDEGRDAAQLSLWLDFLYLALYGSFLALAIRAVADGARGRGREHFARIGVLLWLFPLAAAGLDAAEDVCLLLVLGGHALSLAAPAATVFASVKFAAIAASLGYLLAGLVLRLRARGAPA